MAISTAISSAAVARAVAIKTQYKKVLPANVTLLPQRLAIVGQGSDNAVYSLTKRRVTSAFEVGSLYGYGSPLHLSALEVLPANGDGVGAIPVTIYPMASAVGAVESISIITPSGTVTKSGAYTVKISATASKQFTVLVGDSVASINAKMATALNAVLSMPMVSSDLGTAVELKAKWSGVSSNGLSVSVEGPSDTGITFAIAQPAGGLINPDVSVPLAQMGDIWDSMVLNCLDPLDIVALTAYQEFGEGRWGALTRRPLVVFTGTNESDVSVASAIPETRKLDRVNAYLVAPGCENLPLQIAAACLSRIIVSANSRPANDYGSLTVPRLTAGTDAQQWDYPTRDLAVTSGCSTTTLRVGVVTLSDVVTFYHPDGEEPPAYRYVVDIVKLQNVIHSTDRIFETREWDGVPLIPDGQASVEPTAKHPHNAVSEVGTMLDGLGSLALISDPSTAKKLTVAQIDPSNPKRLDIVIQVQLSNNANIISIDLNFSFFFG